MNNMKIENIAENSLEKVYYSKFLETFNSLFKRKEAMNDRQHQLSVILQIIECSSQHFHTEEYFMAKISYPAYFAHKELHNQFIKTTLEIKGRLEKHELVLSVEFVDMRNWLQKHISYEDQNFATFFHKQAKRPLESQSLSLQSKVCS